MPVSELSIGLTQEFSHSPLTGDRKRLAKHHHWHTQITHLEFSCNGMLPACLPACLPTDTQTDRQTGNLCEGPPLPRTVWLPTNYQTMPDANATTAPIPREYAWPLWSKRWPAKHILHKRAHKCIDCESHAHTTTWCWSPSGVDRIPNHMHLMCKYLLCGGVAWVAAIFLQCTP